MYPDPRITPYVAYMPGVQESSLLEGDADHQLDVPRPSYNSLRSVYAGSAGKFGGHVLWCPQKGHKLQQNGYNRLGTPTEQNMGSGYELLATRCKVEGG